jgi:predicted RNase H-like HicB family nuclease
VKRYTVLLTREDDAYLVSVPAMPNIHTYGRSVEEALARAQEAIELWLEVLRDEGQAFPDDVTTATVEVAA